MVPSEPQNPGPKLSKSLINTPPGVNKPVPFGGREGLPVSWLSVKWKVGRSELAGYRG